MDIAIRVPQEDADEVEGLLAQESVALLRAESRGADGKLVVEFLITLTTVVVPVLARLYRSRLEANRHIQLKYKGLDVKGVSEETLLKLVERAGESHNRP